MRTVLAICIATALSLGLCRTANAGLDNDMAAILKEDVTVRENMVRLGDLFSGLAPAMADKAVAHAPDPGKSMTLDARFLYKLAHNHKLNWTPASRYIRATVTRDGQRITKEDLTEQLKNALRDKGIAGKLDISLGRNDLMLFIPAEAPMDLDATITALDRRTNRFSALVTMPAAGKGLKNIRLHGTFHETEEVPVLLRTIGRGEIVTEEDIDYISMRTRLLRRDTITNVDAVIGMQAKRLLKANAPIRSADLRRPLMVQKNRIVTMVLKTPLMTLTAQGKALQNGSRGDVIKVENAQSTQTVQATVINHNQVVVSNAPALAMK